ncbi:inactive receptor-like serine/threonine-protein kinase At2g40270 [Andrographis paniculata]|uniref:inactive receptor-like serine/threonine-protein kinase At2g40270 n=1 Tax=Andrographis paniculata TaxID=175694 RepID=UPI0021E7AD22|nr:inactive receptor-like serine/threonine-protein kinase At2g40270 [Andrographis paniculata]
MDSRWRRYRGLCPFTRLILSSSLYILNLTLCSSLNNEGAVLLRFKEKLGSDPFGALSNWEDVADTDDPCFWFGVECFDGHVVSLNLRDLCLRGTLPSEIGELIYIKSLILRNNSFSGIIPDEILDLEELQLLDIGYNDFNGELHYGSTTPAVILFDNNELLENRYPKHFRLDHLFEVPAGTKPTPSCNQLSVAGSSGNVIRRTSLQESPSNRRVRKFIIPWDPPAPDLPPNSAPSPTDQNPFPGSPIPSAAPDTPFAPSPLMDKPLRNNNRHYHRHQLLIIYSVAGSSLLLLLVVGIVFWQCSNVASVRPWATGLSGQLQRAFVTGVPKLRRSELEAACEDFSNVIGSSPLLYKGTLSNGTEIAVASIAVTSSKDWSNSMESQFRNKIETLSRVNHKNFASLLGYCIEDVPFTRMMVFEYAPNGTLFEHLHIREAEHLDWATRLRVAMGIAYCLEHMHQLVPPIAHPNLDSSAVYLTEDYAAKVSDFPSASSPLSSRTEPNPSANVYSFGLVLLEMMTGRLLYSAGRRSLEDWASDYLTGTQSLRELVDPTLETFDENQFQEIGGVIRSCAGKDPRRRPDMREVCMRLKAITGMDADATAPRVSPLWWAEVEIMSADAS